MTTVRVVFRDGREEVVELKGTEPVTIDGCITQIECVKGSTQTDLEDFINKEKANAL